MQGDKNKRNQDQTGSFFGQNADFHPSWDCPKKFIIFDRTDNCSQVMYNPALDMGSSYFPGDTTLVQKDANAHGVIEEDSADIDALLSFDDEDEVEEEEASIAQTDGNDTCDASGSCSLKPRNMRVGSTSSHKSKGSLGKHEKMKKMVKSLRGIVPDGNQQMNTVDVLDEAVKYLKSLKVEAHKMGLGNLSG